MLLSKNIGDDPHPLPRDRSQFLTCDGSAGRTLMRSIRGLEQHLRIFPALTVARCRPYPDGAGHPFDNHEPLTFQGYFAFFNDSMPAPDIPSLSQAVFYTFVNNCVLIAGLTTLTYDYLCTIKEEVFYAWTCPWSLGLVLFYLNRYLAFIDQSIILYLQSAVDSPESCVRLYAIAVVSVALGLLSCQSILSLRTCGMWGRPRWVMVTLGTVISTAAIFAIFITVFEIKSVTVEPTLTGTLMLQSTTITLLVFLFVILVESTIGALTVIRAYHYLNQSRSLWARELFSGGIFYCLCIVCLSIVNIVLMCTPSVGAYRAIFISPTRVFHSIFGNRVMLLILRQRHRALRTLPDINARSTTSPAFLTTVGLDWEWDTVQRGDIELDERRREREEEYVT